MGDRRAMDETAIRATLKHYLDHSAAGEQDVAHEIFKEWRRIYPATKVEFDVRRVRGRDDGGPWNYGVEILEFRVFDAEHTFTIAPRRSWPVP
jgi:hypothetical protein